MKGKILHLNFTAKKFKIQILSLILIILNCNIVFAEVVTLNDCIAALNKNHPVVKNQKMIETSSEYKIKNFENEWFPDLYLRANFSDQSDGLPKIDRDKYQINIDIEQIIYDGGVITSRKKIEYEQRNYDLKKIDIELQKLKERISGIYFDILLSTEQIKIFETTKSDLTARLNSVESAVKNGIKLKSDLLFIKSEILNIENNIISKSHRIEAQIAILNELTGLNISNKNIFAVPEIAVSEIEKKDVSDRPEFSLFQIEQEKIGIANSLVNASNKPKINFFMQGGYGKPGLNMFENIAENYALAGFRFNWKLYDWQITENEKLINLTKSKMIEIEKEVFNKNLKTALTELYYEVKTLEKTIIKDRENIAFRKEILDSIISQYNNGVATATEYIINNNNLMNAKNILKVHEIQLGYYLVNYKIIRGGEI